MASFLSFEQLAFISGLIGNILSFLVFLSPIPTFVVIYKKKSSGGYQSIPYAVALSGAILFLYYGFLKSALLIVTINSVGCVIEVAYLIFYLIYAPPKEKSFTLKFVLLLNVGAMGLVLFITGYFVKSPHRMTVVGWICLVYNLAPFAAPLSIVRRVIKTKSVEFMPFNLSLFLTLSAASWFFYGLFVKDVFIATPNVLGFGFGVAQMVLYCIYRGNKKQVEELKEVSMEDQIHKTADVVDDNVAADQKKPVDITV